MFFSRENIFYTLPRVKYRLNYLNYMSQTTLDINSCSAEELTRFTGIPDDISKKVVEYRNSKGAFYHLSEILEVPDIDRASFIRLTGASSKKADECYLRYNIKKIIKLEKASDFTFKDIVKLVSKMPTLAGAMLCSEDGLPIARDFNPLLPADKIGASLSACLKQARDSLKGTPYNNVQSMSIELAGHLITVFNHGKLYLVVLHDHGRISGKVCRLVGEILGKLPQTSLAK